MINIFYLKSENLWDEIKTKLLKAFEDIKKYLAHFMILTKPFDSLLSNEVLTFLQLTLKISTDDKIERK